MDKKTKFQNFFADNWLVLLLAAQPVLDALAFWTQNSVATVAGLLRLLVMLILPLYLLFTLKKKRTFISLMSLIAAFGILHMLNGFRLGYISIVHDLAYYARVIQTPVLAICFIYLIRDEKTKQQAKRGIILAGIIFLATILLSVITGTFTYTYPEEIGLSGWVIDDNRCANSIILVSLAVFAVGLTAMSDSKAAHIFVPVLVTALLIANSTKASYMSLFTILLGFAAFMLFKRILTKDRIKVLLLLTLVLLTAVSILVYPVSPRARVEQIHGKGVSEKQLQFEAVLRDKGYDISSMSLEKKLTDPVLKELFYDYYQSMLGVLPDLYDRFGMDKVYEKYGMTTDATVLIDVRIMKTTYASLIWDECDTLTKLVGFESTETVKNGMYDMENDYPALFYYYGYLGSALYLSFLLYFVYLIIRRLIADFKGSLSMENFTLLLVLLLQLGLAQFSGALFRRPNVSVYLSLVLALIYYNTKRMPVGVVQSAEE